MFWWKDCFLGELNWTEVWRMIKKRGNETGSPLKKIGGPNPHSKC